MTKRNFLTILMACFSLPCIAMLCVLCFGAFGGGSCGGTLASGRSIMTHSDSWYLTSQFSADTATISTSGSTIVVRPNSLSVDGKQVASIDERVAHVEIKVRDKRVEFIADGQLVKTLKR